MDGYIYISWWGVAGVSVVSALIGAVIAACVPIFFLDKNEL